MELTDFEKRIYNAFHIARRKGQNKPFKVRKDFDKIEPETYTALKKLSAFFSDNPTVQIEAFFEAPWKVYEDVGFLQLESFLNRKAITWYTLYMTKRRQVNPDTDDGLEDSQSALRFVFNYCKENKLTLDAYLNKTEGDIPLILFHLRNYDVNFYLIHSLEIHKILYNIGVDWLDFYISNFDNLFHETKRLYNQSTKNKKLLLTALKIIKEKLEIYE